MTCAGSPAAIHYRKWLLRLTATQGYYLAPFARMMLAVAALRENKPQEARAILIELKKEFPSNALYDRELALIH